MRTLTLLILILIIIFSPGCKSGITNPINPFALTRQGRSGQTVPPPGTFSSQESYLGQTPGNYVPQTPATTFPSSGTHSPTQPAAPPSYPVPSNVTNSNAANNASEKASLFTPPPATEKETDWSPADVASTSNTAFQAMEAKVKSTSFNEGGTVNIASGIPETLIVGSSPAITTIIDGAQPESVPAEAQLLYSGKYGE